jgi:hypothetical protein
MYPNRITWFDYPNRVTWFDYLRAAHFVAPIFSPQVRMRTTFTRT